MPILKDDFKYKGRFRHNCDQCGHFVGKGGYMALDFGVDGMGPETVDEVVCKPCFDADQAKEIINFDPDF